MRQIVATTIALALIGVLAACADVTRTRDLTSPDMSAAVIVSQVCSMCHGANGVSTVSKFPRLAGQQPDYIVAQLQNFRDHSRSDPLAEEFMWAIARKLSDAQIEAIADLLGGQQAPPNAPVDEAVMAAGKKIYTEGIASKAIPACMMCHGPNGEGFGAFPRLAFQHQSYMIGQLRVFKSGRGRPETPMSAIVPNMSEEEMVAVTGYLQGMPISP
jgi:cytochrome c553